MLVWMLKGEKAGKFVALPTEEATRAIEAGEAQIARTSAPRKPQYQTREITAAKPDKDAPAPKPRKKRKAKVSED